MNIGENLHRRQPLFAKYLSRKATQNKKFLPLFKYLYSMAACIPFFYYSDDLELVKIFIHYAKNRSLFVLLTENTKKSQKKSTNKAKFVNFPLFSRLLYTSCSGVAKDIPKRISKYSPAHTRTKFCCTVFSNTTPQRIKICKLLSQIKHVDVFGSNPITQGKPENTKNFSSLPEFYSQYRFVICFENSIQEGYITEKLYNVLISGAVPIYFGAGDVCKYVHKNAMLHVEKSMMSIVQRVSQLEKDTCALADYAHAPHFTDAQRQYIENQWKEYDAIQKVLQKYTKTEIPI